MKMLNNFDICSIFSEYLHCINYCMHMVCYEFNFFSIPFIDTSSPTFSVTRIFHRHLQLPNLNNGLTKNVFSHKT